MATLGALWVVLFLLASFAGDNNSPLPLQDYLLLCAGLVAVACVVFLGARRAGAGQVRSVMTALAVVIATFVAANLVFVVGIVLLAI